jgi:hypothetical protein
MKKQKNVPLVGGTLVEKNGGMSLSHLHSSHLRGILLLLEKTDLLKLRTMCLLKQKAGIDSCFF